MVVFVLCNPQVLMIRVHGLGCLIVSNTCSAWCAIFSLIGANSFVLYAQFSGDLT